MKCWGGTERAHSLRKAVVWCQSPKKRLTLFKFQCILQPAVFFTHFQNKHACYQDQDLHVTQWWGLSCLGCFVSCTSCFILKFWLSSHFRSLVLPHMSPVWCLPWSLIVSTCSPLPFCVLKSASPLVLCQSVSSVAHLSSSSQPRLI